tara:strand:+ start:44 stop:469 length:426 start_codon:yes stop_codon:yes gene_type:complete
MIKIYENWRLFLEKAKDIDEIAKAVVFKDNKILLLKRSNYLKKYAGEWDLPGGHLVEDEATEDGLRREVEEETNLSLKNIKKLTKDGKMSYFKADAGPEDIKLSDEHTEHKYFSESELEGLSDLPAKYRNAINKALSNDDD